VLATVSMIAFQGSASHAHGSDGPVDGEASTEVSAHEHAEHSSDDHEDHDHAGREDGATPCTSCVSECALLCSFVVITPVASPVRARDLPSIVHGPQIRVSLRSWTPDPPVPRLGLVAAT
jgi:hypothetical protein